MTQWKFKPFHEHDFGPELLEVMKAKGVAMPDLVPNQSNNGAVFVYEMDENGETTNIVCDVRCQTEFPRGQGHKAKCAIRDERANLISAAPDMFEALREITDAFTLGYAIAHPVSKAAIAKARAALLKASPKPDGVE